jgi:hypothetical protein
MTNKYKNRRMESEAADDGEVFFFPKENPPVAIKAKSQAEAEEKLKAINK